NRSAESMTLFAVICAAIFPGIHVGRVWMAWYLAPLPNNYGIWPNFRSPLMWDVFAVSTYFTVSVLFWYTGLVPDLATLRDRATSKIRKLLFGIFALGWRGSNRHWRHYEMAYLLLAGLSTPLVSAERLRRLLRVHVRKRRDVVRALHHHRRRIAPGFSDLVMGLVHPNMGRYLDLYRYARHFHLALPDLHPFPADDRDV